jgi:[ribosomal protein S5]-alanine N-acetyltransferase
MSPDPRPSLQTARLHLRPFHPADAPDVQELANDPDIADTTLRIPHPYADGLALQWIWTQRACFLSGESVTFAVTLADGGTLIGSIGLELERRWDRAELGYWIGKPFWNCGYCTEAARAVVRYGFTALPLHRIHATHFRRNPASGRVLEKIGMRCEGMARGHVKKNGHYEDLVLYAILRQDWQQ